MLTSIVNAITRIATKQTETLDDDAIYNSLHLGNVFFEQNNFSASALHFKKAINLGYKSYEFFNEIAEKFHHKKQYKFAMDFLLKLEDWIYEKSDKCFDENPTLKYQKFRTLYTKAHCLKDTKEFKKALEYYNLAYKCNYNPKPEYWVLLDIAEVHILLLEYDEALKKYHLALQSNPQCSVTFNRLGILYALKKRYLDAKNSFLTSLHYHTHPSVISNLADCFYFLQDYDAAIESANHALSLDGSLIFAKCILIASYYEKQEYETAKKLFSQLPKDEILTDASVFAIISKVYFLLNDTQNSILNIQKAIKIDYKIYSVCLEKDELGNDIDFLNNLASEFYNLNDYDRAQEVITKILNLEPKNFKALHTKARILIKKEDWKGNTGIKNVLLLMKDIEPQDVFTLRNLGNYEHENNNLNDALKYYQEVLTITYYHEYVIKRVFDIYKKDKSILDAKKMKEILRNSIDNKPQIKINLWKILHEFYTLQDKSIKASNIKSLITLLENVSDQKSAEERVKNEINFNSCSELLYFFGNLHHKFPESCYLMSKFINACSKYYPTDEVAFNQFQLSLKHPKLLKTSMTLIINTASKIKNKNLSENFINFLSTIDLGSKNTISDIKCILDNPKHNLHADFIKIIDNTIENCKSI